MNKITFLKKDPKVAYTGEKVSLPKDVMEKIEWHWEALIGSGKKFKRGDVFTITGVRENKEEAIVEIALSDYAHYLATINGVINNEHACRVVHSSVMIETSDGELILGEMGGDTALPGRIQCIGGGITREDLFPDGKLVDIRKNAANEMLEEVGLFADDPDQVKTFSPWAIVESGPHDFLGVVYWAKLSIDSDEFRKGYRRFEDSLKEKGEKAELSRIVSIPMDLKDKKRWLVESGNPYAEYLPLIFDII